MGSGFYYSANNIIIFEEYVWYKLYLALNFLIINVKKQNSIKKIIQRNYLRQIEINKVKGGIIFE